MTAGAGELPARRYTVTRADVEAYALASGDQNPIHHDDAAARAAGLPGVVAHGMLTLGLAARAMHDWLGPDAEVHELRTAFARPVPIPETGGVEVTVGGRLDAPGDSVTDGPRRVRLTVTVDGEKVLTRASAVVGGDAP